MSAAGRKSGEGEKPRGFEDLGRLELVAVARAAKTRGVRGEIAADLLTDFPERFEWLEELVGVSPTGERKVLKLERQWLHGGRVILKFEGYDTPEAAQALVGFEFAVPEDEAVELEEDEFYDWQLVGCRAETVDHVGIGTVREVLHTAAAPVLVIRDERERENLVPLVESICVEIDVERKLIRVDAPEGLLETAG
ncbi:MAG TPA: ribosome maturation factor RimM [Pyrinomonadaceae bacterium]|jgi:16S rRNA processing protein RimM|nr:ribosome maturation factor RimM [Pyrinomonadaceae bacterium]